MSFSVETQDTRKAAQLARIAAKGSPGYGALYAAQPEQLRKELIYKADRKAFSDSKNAENAQALADAEAGIEAFENISTKKGAK